MAMNIRVNHTHKNEAIKEFVPLKKPLMSFDDAFILVKSKYKDAFDYLADK